MREAAVDALVGVPQFGPTLFEDHCVDFARFVGGTAEQTAVLPQNGETAVDDDLLKDAFGHEPRPERSPFVESEGGEQSEDPFGLRGVGERSDGCEEVTVADSALLYVCGFDGSRHNAHF